MGMTIDEAIRRIDEHNYIHQRKEPRAVHITEAFDTLIEVAKKYQKIREIAFSLQFCSTDKLEHEAIMKICEVLENGTKNSHHAPNSRNS